VIVIQRLLTKNRRYEKPHSIIGVLFLAQSKPDQEEMRRVGSLPAPSDEGSRIEDGSSSTNGPFSTWTHPTTTVVSRGHHTVPSCGRNLESAMGRYVGRVPDMNNADDDSFHTFPRQSDGGLPIMTTTPYIEAHLAPNESIIYAEVMPQVEAEAMQLSEESMTEAPFIKSVHARIKIAVAVIVPLVLVATAGFFLLRPREEKPPTAVIPSRTMAPSNGPLDPLLIELGDIIAPTKEDLLHFEDPILPQSMALEWLHDDPITLKPDRTTRTVLERYVLAVLYFSTSGATWDFPHPYLTDAHVCDWNGESAGMPGDKPLGGSCQNSNRTIDTINFIGVDFQGTIPWEIVLLGDLSYLTLSRGFLGGGIPSRITELTHLSVLDLLSNYLAGTLPQALPSSLLNLRLGYNFFTGPIPASWGGTMSNLGNLSVSNNRLRGTIPTTFGQLQKLTALEIGTNKLTGEIPSELGQIDALSAVSFDHNRFTGSVNTIFCGRSNMIVLKV